MKNFLIVLTLCAFGVSSVFAQTPAADAKAARRETGPNGSSGVRSVEEEGQCARPAGGERGFAS